MKDIYYKLIFLLLIFLNEATFYGKPLCMYKINSEGSIAYMNLSYEVINRN